MARKAYQLLDTGTIAPTTAGLHYFDRQQATNAMTARCQAALTANPTAVWRVDQWLSADGPIVTNVRIGAGPRLVDITLEAVTVDETIGAP